MTLEQTVEQVRTALPHASAGYANAVKLIDKSRFAVLQEAMTDALAALTEAQQYADNKDARTGHAASRESDVEGSAPFGSDTLTT